MKSPGLMTTSISPPKFGPMPGAARVMNCAPGRNVPWTTESNGKFSSGIAYRSPWLGVPGSSRAKNCDASGGKRKAFRIPLNNVPPLLTASRAAIASGEVDCSAIPQGVSMPGVSAARCSPESSDGSSGNATVVGGLCPPSQGRFRSARTAQATRSCFTTSPTTARWVRRPQHSGEHSVRRPLPDALETQLGRRSSLLVRRTGGRSTAEATVGATTRKTKTCRQTQRIPAAGAPPPR
jgi:hypothetical protein